MTKVMKETSEAHDALLQLLLEAKAYSDEHKTHALFILQSGRFRQPKRPNQGGLALGWDVANDSQFWLSEQGRLI